MTEVSINAVSAPQIVAELCANFRPDGLTVEMDGSLVELHGRREFGDFTELQFSGEGWRTARVTIERPREGYGRLEPAKVAWSSGGQNDLASARATSRLLDFAVRVAEQLDAWAAAGQLPYLVPPERRVGALVDVAIFAAGAPTDKPVGKIRGRIANSGSEAMVAVPASEQPELDWLFERAGCGDLDTNDLLRETEDGPVLMLDAIQWEQVELAEVSR